MRHTPRALFYTFSVGYAAHDFWPARRLAAETRTVRGGRTRRTTSLSSLSCLAMPNLSADVLMMRDVMIFVFFDSVKILGKIEGCRRKA